MEAGGLRAGGRQHGARAPAITGRAGVGRRLNGVRGREEGQAEPAVLAEGGAAGVGRGVNSCQGGPVVT